MAKPGRNDLCPCGSGKKYKKCCEGTERAAATFTRAERMSAYVKLERFIEEQLGPEDDAALDEFWGAYVDQDIDLDEHDDALSTNTYDVWFSFDRPLDDGTLAVDRFLETGPALTAGERAFLQAMRASSLRLYEVMDAVPGASLTLRDVLEDDLVTVNERSGSRTIDRHEWLAARVNPRGPSGGPEMEAGVLHVPRLLHQSVREQLSAAREAYLREHPGAGVQGFYKTLPPFFHEVWVGSIIHPVVPELQTTDGEPLVITRVTFEVTDAAALKKALDGAGQRGIERGGDSAWTWSGNNQAGKPVVFGSLQLEGGALVVECHSVQRGERGRALVEELAGVAIRHRATTHEDAGRLIQERLRQHRKDAAAGRSVEEKSSGDQLPRHVMEELALDHYAQHYRAWLDEPVPALDGATPRAAAKRLESRPKVVELLHGLEGLYQGALRLGQPAYDPSWMWAELGLAESKAPTHPPPLAHERLADLLPGVGELARRVAERVRGQAGFDVASTVVTEKALRLDLDVQRFLREPERDEDVLFTALPLLVNHELHRRKVFWVDESLAYMLDQTDADLPASEIRLPFPAFAVVFTDRQILSLAERLIAGNPALPLSGQLLRVLTVYATEELEPSRSLGLTFALDALGPDLPYLSVHKVPLGERPPLDGYFTRMAGTAEPPIEVGARDPLRGLLRVAINAILYATGAGVEPELRTAPVTEPRPRAGALRVEAPRYSSDGVYFLSGAIEISRVRRMQDLERNSTGRGLLHRFLVRGHWRRAAANWSDQRARWVQPYWKGPDMAAVIERAYKLKP